MGQGSSIPRPFTLFIFVGLLVTAFLAGALSRATQTAATPASLNEDIAAGDLSEHVPGTNFGQAMAALQRALAQDDEFTVHYTAAYLAQAVDTDVLEELVARSGELDGDRIVVVRLILALELIQRSPDRFRALVISPRVINPDTFSVADIFVYFAKSRPDTAFELSLKLPDKLRLDALHGIWRSNNKRARSLVARHRDALNRSNLQQEYERRQENLLEAIRSRSYEEDQNGFISLYLNAFDDDHEAAVAAAQQVEDVALRKRLLQHTLNRDAFDSIPDPERKRSIAEVFNRLMQAGGDWSKL